MAQLFAIDPTFSFGVGHDRVVVRLSVYTVGNGTTCRANNNRDTEMGKLAESRVMHNITCASQ